MRTEFKIRAALAACLAACLLLSGLSALGQAAYATPNFKGQYTPYQIFLPIGTNSLATATSTNLYNGWTNSTTSTNITSLWNVSSNAFINTTNIITNSVISRAIFDAQDQRFIPLEVSASADAGNAANGLWFWVARSTSGTSFDTGTWQMIELLANATNSSSANVFTYTTNLDMLGSGFAQIMVVSNGTGAGLTNITFKSSNINSASK